MSHQSTSTQPYLIRALYEWCLDNAYTPHIAVWVNEHTRVPKHLVKDEQIVLNIAPTATKDLFIDNDHIVFHARFGGVSQEVWLPIGHVMGIFARETGEGMGFEVQAWNPSLENETDQVNVNSVAEVLPDQNDKPKKGLKLVK